MTVWGNNDDPSDKVTEAYADMLNDIGLDATPKIIDGGVYFQTIGNAKTEAQTGFTNWFQDFPHPLNFYFLVDGDSIQPTNNQNFGNVDDPEINDEIDRLAGETDLPAVAEDWAALDQVLVAPAELVHRAVGPPQVLEVPVRQDRLRARRSSTRCISTTTRAGS